MSLLEEAELLRLLDLQLPHLRNGSNDPFPFLPPLDYSLRPSINAQRRSQGKLFPPNPAAPILPPLPSHWPADLTI